MKTNFLKSIFCIALASVVFTGCVNDDDYSVPSLECTDTAPAATKTVAEIYAQATTTATLYSADDVIEARVVSSDKGGNFYKVVYLTSLDGTRGFSVAINQSDLFSDYNVGRKIAIKLQGLYTQIRNNTLQIGALYQGNVGQIAAATYKASLKRTCDVVDEETLVNSITLSQISNDYIGKLIELQDVQFADSALGQNYYNPQNVVGSETNHQITDATGATLIFRTGNFAEYKAMPVSSKSGNIRGILTKFGSDFQFVARYTTDIKLTEDRIGGEPEEPETPSGTSVGGTDIQFSGTVNENFESYAITNPYFTAFPKYVNDKTTGERYWQVKQFPTNTGNKYIEMTSYTGTSTPGIVGKTYFFVPVNFTAANTFTFKKEFRYMAGAALKVYYVTAANYTAGQAVNVGTYTDITSSFTGLTYPANGASENSFTTAGTYAIPASLTGNGFFVFEYTGTATVTTTVQIDEIVIN